MSYNVEESWPRKEEGEILYKFVGIINGKEWTLSDVKSLYENYAVQNPGYIRTKDCFGSGTPGIAWDWRLEEFITGIAYLYCKFKRDQ